MKRFCALALMMLLALQALEAGAATTYRLSTVAPTVVDEHGVCKQVSGGAEYFIPTGSADEWNAFLAHPPTGVTLADCAPSLCCPAGYSYVEARLRCEKPPTCAAGTTYSAANNRCEQTVITGHTCAAGYSYVAARARCEKTPTCPVDYTYHTGADVCYKYGVAGYSCPGGYTYISSRGRCEKAPTCPAGYSYSVPNNRCEKATTVSAPASYSTCRGGLGLVSQPGYEDLYCSGTPGSACLAMWIASYQMGTYFEWGANCLLIRRYDTMYGSIYDQQALNLQPGQSVLWAAHPDNIYRNTSSPSCAPGWTYSGGVCWATSVVTAATTCSPLDGTYDVCTATATPVNGIVASALTTCSPLDGTYDVCTGAASPTYGIAGSATTCAPLDGTYDVCTAAQGPCP